MKFAHIADCHIGSWREPKLREVSIKAFLKAMDKCVEKQVDFILISGDLFNTSLPAIDKLKTTVIKLKELKEKGIPVYIIAGSHDFSPSGKTILDVLESAGLFVNVVKGEVKDNKLKLNFTVDEKTGVKITGMLGKRGMLEKSYYENLLRENLEQEPGFKIFMFHTAITELKPKELERMDSAPLSLLPRGFDYYAGGHVHIVDSLSVENYKNVAYPGPIFPNSFSELEKLGNGGFYIYEDGILSYEQLKLHGTVPINVDCNHLTPQQVDDKIKNELKDKSVKNNIVLLKLTGILEAGRVSDVNFNELFDMFYHKGAYFVMKNTSALKTKEFEEIKIDTSSVEEIESNLIKEHLGQIKVTGVGVGREEELTGQLISILNRERHEGEKVTDFEKRVKEEVGRILGV